MKLRKDRSSLNLSLLDHLGTFSNEVAISKIGFSQPPENAADSILTDTTEDRENLRIGSVEVVRESDSSLEIRLTARYKPENEDEFETDRWGTPKPSSNPHSGFRISPRPKPT